VRRRELVLAAVGAAFARPAVAAAAAGEADIVMRLIVAEQQAAFAYRRRPGPADFGLHEEQHASALRSQLSALGRAGPESPRSPSELDGPARRVVEAGEGAVLGAQIELEASLLAAYRRALVELAEPSILRTAATIAAGHAQHHALLRRRAEPDWTPDIGSRRRG
jgi:ferritin-like protein